MIFGPKDYIIGGLGLALALSLAGTSWMYDQVQDANKAAGVAEESRRQAVFAVGICNEAVTTYEKAAAERAALMEPVITEGKDFERNQGTKAQVILGTAPSQPDNDCESAKDLAIDWLKGRRK